MKKDPGLSTLILRIARANEEAHKDERGGIDKEALCRRSIDEFGETHPDAFEMLEGEAVWGYVWEIISKAYRDTRSGMGSLVEPAGEEAEPRLPSFEMVAPIKLGVPLGDNRYESRDMIGCTLEELQAVADDYAKRARSMMQLQRFVATYVKEMRRREFAATDTVRKLYVAA